MGVEPPTDLDTVAEAFVDLPLAEGAADAVRALREARIATGVLTNASRRTLDMVAAGLDLELDYLLSV
ncbi:MAG: hypothetical protein E6I45_04385, partial [Chloroflexi bacterium]